ncbi:hypothetical protein ASB1_06340 [Helicobacter heilmannii]|nr:hypothetical protein ASB1_06340 [Helicobacter heilmannii]
MNDRLTPPTLAQDALSAGISAIKAADYKSAFRLFVKSCNEGNPGGPLCSGHDIRQWGGDTNRPRKSHPLL